MAFPRQEYWSGLSFLSPGDLPDPELELVSLVLADRFLPLHHLGPGTQLKYKHQCTYDHTPKNLLKIRQSTSIQGGVIALS